MLKRLILIGASGLVLTACSTTYSDKNIAGQGVSSMAISGDTYRISALGNALTKKEEIQDFTLLKAAETTVQSGYTHFTVIQSRDDSRSSVESGIFSPGVTTLHQPGDEMVIRVFTLKNGEALPPNSYSAQEVISTVGPRVKR